MPDFSRDRFLEQGFVGPVRVLSVDRCRRFLRAVMADDHPPPLDWFKGHAATSSAFYNVATDPAIIDPVVALLGNDVMLWSASIQARAPGAVHAWHTDIESSDPSARTVAVWIGLENTQADSSLFVIPHSHRLSRTVQEARHERGKRRDEATDEDVVGWARERDGRCHLLKTETTDGEALFFDGNLWHASRNLLDTTRRALLLQYATPSSAIHIPDLNFPDWPFRLLNVPRPPCILLRGSGDAAVNRFVPPPAPPGNGAGPRSTSRVHPIETPLPLDDGQTWKPYPTFSCSTAELQTLTCHVSALAPGASPHPPHRHQEEELLLLLTGEIELILGDEGETRVHLTPGELAYYPANFAHTLQTRSDDTANYLMLKWFAEADQNGRPSLLGHGVFSALESADAADAFHVRLLFENPTGYLRKLRCHASTLAPGAGYEPHADAHDVVIVVHEGEVETLGERVGPHGVIFYRAGEPHGMHNPGDKAARYVVFEFHGLHNPLREGIDLRSDSVDADVRPPSESRRRALRRRLFERA